MLKNNKISFLLDTSRGFNSNTILPPEPCVSLLPEWFKSMEPVPPGFKKVKILDDGNTSFTIKKCFPFRDSLSLGYFIMLNCDVEISERSPEESVMLLDRKVGPKIVWRNGVPGPIDMHDERQVYNIEVGSEFYKIPYKFINNFSIKTPKGYSCLITHPLNRTDLPFNTLSAVVETDIYDGVVNFPFLLKNNFTGILKRGTPIAQIIPFKRDSWTKDIKDSLKTTDEDILLRLETSRYSKKIWQRKNFK